MNSEPCFKDNAAPSDCFVQDTFAAQKKLLSDASRDVFELQTREKANKHKVDRLHDYEKQIDQLIALQRLWYE